MGPAKDYPWPRLATDNVADRHFLVFEVPAEDARLDAIARQCPGCRVDVVGKPLIREEGHAYLLHYVVTGVDGATRMAMLRELGKVNEEIQTVVWDEAAGVWEMRGIIAVENIHSQGLRFVAGLFGLIQAPWMLMQDGKVSVRLFPREAALMPDLAEAVDARMATLGIEGHPRVEDLDLAQYRRRARCVGIEIST